MSGYQAAGEKTPLANPLESYAALMTKNVDQGGSRNSAVSKTMHERLSRGNLGSLARPSLKEIPASLHTTVFGISLPRNFWRIVAAAAFAMVASLTTTVSNRLLFKRCGFPPIVAQPFQMLGSVLISAAFGEMVHAAQPHLSEDERPWPRFRIEWHRVKQICALSFAFIPRILFTNESLRRTPISTYQILRSSAVGFSAVLTWIVFGTPPTIFTALSCLIILGGVGVASFDASVLSNEALIYWLLAATSTSLYLVLLKYFLPVVNNKQAHLLNYNTFISFWFLLGYVILAAFLQFKWFEDSKKFFPFFTEFDWTDPNVKDAWRYMSLSVVASFFINIAQMTLIKEASAVTADVVGTAKGSIQVVYGVAVMGESSSIYNLTGSVMSIVGSLCFGKSKHMEHKEKLRKAVAEAKRKSAARQSMIKTTK